MLNLAWISPTSVNTTAGIGTTFEFLNTVTMNWFGRMLMIAIFVIFLSGYLSARRDDYFGAFAVASYVTFVMGLLFWVIDLVTGLDFAIIIGITIVSSVILFIQKNKN